MFEKWSCCYMSTRTLLVILITGIFSCACKSDSVSSETQKEGEIFVLEDEIKNSKIKKLQGSWRFFWNQLPLDSINNYNTDFLKSSEFTSMKDDSWSNYGYPPKGYGTFRLKITNKAINLNLAMKIKRVSSACIIWANGKKLVEHGTFSRNYAQSIPDGRPLFFQLPQEKEIDLVISIVNDHQRYGGGIIYDTYFSTLETFTKEQERDRLIEFSLSFFMLMIALIHLFVYLFISKKRILVYFVLFCLFIGSRQLFVDQAIIYELFPSINFDIILMWRYITMYFTPVIFLLYYKEILAKETRNFIRNLVIVLNTTCFVYTLLVSSNLVIHSLLVYNVSSMIVLVYTIFLSIKASIGNKPYSKLVLVNILIVSVLFSLDLFVELELSIGGQMFSNIATLFIILIQILINYVALNSSKKESLELSNKVIDIENRLYDKDKESMSLLVESTRLMKEKEQIAQKVSEVYKKTKNFNFFKVLLELRASNNGNRRKLLIREQLDRKRYDLIAKLKEQFPSLTENDLELCTLIVLDITSREISELKSITQDSVKKHRYRVRKKLNLDKDITLKNFLDQYQRINNVTSD